MGKAWGLIQGWLDDQAITDITDAQLGRLIGFSQSNFPTWRNPKTLPPRETIGAIAKALQLDFITVRDAFLEDLRYGEPPTEEEMEAAKEFRKGRVAGRSRTDVQEYEATPLKAPNKPAKRRTSPSDKP